MNNLTESNIVLSIFLVAASLFWGDVVHAQKVESTNGSISLERQVQHQMAQIKSVNELVQYVSDNPEDSPLMLLSENARQEFLDSLVWRESGVAGYYMDPLERELTPTQIFNILKLFGLQDQVRYFRLARVESVLDQLLLKRDMENDEVTASFGTPNDSTSGPNERGDYEGYHCFAPSTCREATKYICLSSC